MATKKKAGSKKKPKKK